jgi:hypothetical protein
MTPPAKLCCGMFKAYTENKRPNIFLHDLINLETGKESLGWVVDCGYGHQMRLFFCPFCGRKLETVKMEDLQK